MSRHRFPDGEIRITTGPAAPTSIIYAALDQPNDKLIAIVFVAEALRNERVKVLGAIRPILPEAVASQTVRGQYRQMFKNKLYDLFRPQRPAAPGRGRSWPSPSPTRPRARCASGSPI